jgi:hypothetical protein
MTLLNPGQRAVRRKRVVALLGIAQLGYAHWFFGNRYEAVVRVPDRLARDYTPGGEDRRLASVLSAGSPVRYYLPGVPVVVGATVSALVAGWSARRERPWLGVMALSALAGIVATAYLVAAVNRSLFVAGQTLTRSDQDRLLRTWYRLNGARLLTAGGAWLLAGWLAARLRSSRAD